MQQTQDRWTKQSVRSLAGSDDPVETVVRKARAAVVKALDEGWSGTSCIASACFEHKPMLTPSHRPSSNASATLSPALSPSPSPTSESSPKASPVSKVLFDKTGEGISKTAIFTTPSEWSLTYSFDCLNFGQQGNFAITVFDGKSNLVDLPVDALALKGSDTIYEHNLSGPYYLEIDSECNWHVTVNG